MPNFTIDIEPKITATAATSDPSDTGQQSNANHLAAVDALRGIAALYVIAFHVMLVPTPNLVVPGWLRPIVAGGGMGVPLFFVVSAFTLSLSWFARRDGRYAQRNFYVRRVFRIVPLFYALLFVTILRDWRHWHQIHSAGEIALSAAMVFNLVPGHSMGIVWASWTIGVEMLFYLLFPLIIPAARGGAAQLGTCLAGTLCLSLALFVGLRSSSLSPALQNSFYATSVVSAMPIFVMGIVAYVIFRSSAFGRFNSPANGALLICVALPGHLVLAYAGVYATPGSSYFAAALWVLLVLGLAMNPVGPIVNSVTRFYGRISYSMYLNHPVVVVFLTSAYFGIYHRLPANPLAAYLCCFALTLAVLTPLSWCSYVLVEQPGIRLGSRLLKGLKR